MRTLLLLLPPTVTVRIEETNPLLTTPIWSIALAAESSIRKNQRKKGVRFQGAKPRTQAKARLWLESPALTGV